MKTTALALIILSGCMGSKPSGTSQDPPDGVTARELFERDVYPILATKCAGCHSSVQVGLGFMGTDVETSYERVTEDKALVGDDFSSTDAPILLLHDKTHQGMLGYSAGELVKLRNWLMAEMGERR